MHFGFFCYSFAENISITVNTYIFNAVYPVLRSDIKHLSAIVFKAFIYYFGN